MAFSIYLQEKKCLNQMHKEEKSFMKEKKRKTSSKSSRKSDRKIVQIHKCYCQISEYTISSMKKRTLQNTLLMPSLMTNRKIVQIHQVLLPNLQQSTHERILSTEKALQNTLLMPSKRDGNAIQTLLMTAQINTDFFNSMQKPQYPYDKLTYSLNST
ncbi:UNVERIFIED_CONTAM: hypothetical protein NCL1_49534 [Trichonephila clavipes]